MKKSKKGIDISKLDKYDLHQICRYKELLSAWSVTADFTTLIAPEARALEYYLRLSGHEDIVNKLKEAQERKELIGVFFLDRLMKGEV